MTITRTSEWVCPQNGIDVWVCHLEDVRAQAGLADAYRDLLGGEEQERQKRFRFEADRFRYLVTRALVRTTLSHYGALPPRDWQFGINDYGRPHLASACAPSINGLDFNVSHAGDRVVLALSAAGPLGIDIERIEDRGDLTELAANFFAREEADALTRLKSKYRLPRFFEYWTLKEAYIKARGIGLSIPLDAFWFALDAPGAIGFRTSEASQTEDGWIFWQGDLGRDYMLALCAGHRVSRPNLRFFRTVPNVSTRSIGWAPARVTRTASVAG